jgi:hypothetical protein
MAERQAGADAAVADLREFSAVEAEQHDEAAGIPGGGDDQVVEEA